MFAFALCAFVPALPAQPLLHLGGHAGWQRSWHKTAQDVRSLEGDCGQFTSGSGNGFSTGLLGEIELMPWLRGSLRLSYAQLGGTLRTTCDNGIIVPTGKDNEFAPLVREYEKVTKLDYGLIDIGLKVLPFDFPLFVSGGLSIGTPMFRASWSQDERVVSPEGALFPGFVASRSDGGGDFANTKLRSALRAGLGYAFTLRARAELSPEISYTHPLTNVTTDGLWKVSTFTAGMSLTWPLDLHREEPPPPPPPPPLPPPPPPPPPAAPVARIGTATDASVSITETFVTETFPVLPYIFFEKGSVALASKYVKSDRKYTPSFTEAALPRKTLSIYYHVLDIMGKRLHDHPDIAVTLIGSTDDKAAEKGDTALAAGRARAVKAYFTSAWGIDERRIGITTQRLPPIPTSQIYAEGDEENRRVDIASASSELFRPVVHEHFSEFTITPPVMEMTLGADASSALAAWTVTVRHHDADIAEFHGSGAPPASIQWQLGDSVAIRVGEHDTLRAMLEVRDAIGGIGRSELPIPVHKQQNTFEVGRLSLIVFDFDRSEILPFNQRMIKRFVAEAISASSSVIITGSTDRLGEAEHNMELSAARADNVKAILLSQHPRYEQLEARGIGAAPDLYDNNLPEGRFYCRTVAVEVKTPVAPAK